MYVIHAFPALLQDLGSKLAMSLPRSIPCHGTNTYANNWLPPRIPAPCDTHAALLDAGAAWNPYEWRLGLFHHQMVPWKATKKTRLACANGLPLKTPQPHNQTNEALGITIKSLLGDHDDSTPNISKMPKSNIHVVGSSQVVSTLLVRKPPRFAGGTHP
ncbi:hypothetical protein GQ44DRAFT_505055 [Phaeosphaeriaceae sp. PMI808]|nr:hypothetical protein GQ44DRAFT_505055 [Phaeosphaeriaceae sp. PMI808]